MKARVVVAMPAQGSVKSKTSLCLAEMCLKFGHRIKEVWSLDRTYLHRSREALMEAAVATDATHLLFVDSDVIFAPDAIERLLRQQLGIVGATYHLKKQGERIMAHKPLDTPYDGSRAKRVVQTPRQTHEVRAVPTGFMLVDLEVVRQVPRPWFDFSANDAQFVGEDVWFCERLREHGHKIWLDPTVSVGHIGDYIY